MSKRFGRNQRRKAREEIARLGTAARMANELAAYNGQRRREAEEELSDAKAFLAPFCAAFKPSSLTISGRARDGVALASYEPMSLEPISGPMERETTFSRVPLQMLLADVRQDRIRDCLHAEVHFGDGTVAYGISRQALLSMPKGRLVRMVAEQLARAIAERIGRVA